ncbi:hypothetical protein T01_6733 [Trichinella spiralis]|uniref:Uncharacterized protein n=1 Tax=Trichinella spiralis TaxID=6334 RepID=A0A0V1B905_TRISP|nr:hypothetical protein T01_6733 [Trichinella spiralis]
MPQSHVRISVELILFMKASRIISSRYCSAVTFLYSQFLLSRWSACSNYSSDSPSILQSCTYSKVDAVMERRKIFNRSIPVSTVSCTKFGIEVARTSTPFRRLGQRDR